MIDKIVSADHSHFPLTHSEWQASVLCAPALSFVSPDLTFGIIVDIGLTVHKTCFHLWEATFSRSTIILLIELDGLSRQVYNEIY